jgi:selenocysteine lyase/cysteine desulfurase
VTPRPEGRPRSPLAEAQALFPHGYGYLDTASVGLPPTPVTDAMRTAIDVWERGRAAPADYDAEIDRAREAFGRLVGVPGSAIAVASQVSYFTGLIAASLRPGARVLCPDDEFTSVVFPFLAREHEGVEVVTAPLEGLAERIEVGDLDLVAFSAVQSADGRVADLEAIVEASGRHGVTTYLDATQAVGWLPLQAGRFDYVSAGAYKWLLSPRGTAFLAVRAERLGDLPPLAASWYAGEDRWDSIYGPPLRLAAGARRLDVSPAWLCWGPTCVALELLEAVGVDRIHEHDVGLANALRERIGLPASDSAIVSVTVGEDVGPLPSDLRASVRAGRLRVGFHLHNTPADVDLVAAHLCA